MEINNINWINQSLSVKSDQNLKEQPEELLKACKEFESILVNLMLKQMRATVPVDSEKSQAREIYESMYDEALSQELVQGEGLGLAKQLYQQLSTFYQRPSYEGQE
ncbi:rod-binding protein [Alkaliphilus crotonatoxidans]